MVVYIVTRLSLEICIPRVHNGLIGEEFSALASMEDLPIIVANHSNVLFPLRYTGHALKIQATFVFTVLLFELNEMCIMSHFEDFMKISKIQHSLKKFSM